MNPDSKVEIFLCASFENGHCESLCNLACMWTHEMESDNATSICDVCNQFSIAIVITHVVEVPFKRLI